MTPVFLQRAQLCSALAPDLHGAARAWRAGLPPEPDWFALNELGARRPLLPAQGAGANLQERLDRLVVASGDDPWGDCLLVVASTTLDIADLEARAVAGAPLDARLSTPLDRLASELQARWGFAAAFTLNTACTSAANALLYAARLLNAGRYHRALVIGFETLSQVAQQGFGVLELTSPSGHYRPFHPARDGLILGEAYASALLSREPEATPLGRLLGGFSACDTSSLTTTREDGSHIDWVMQRAAQDAQVALDELALVKLHGTATQANDQAEANGMRRTFGERLPALALLKPALGHTLGACGLSETLLLLEALRQGGLPGSAYAGDALLPLAGEAFEMPADACLMANYFGFGGNNASLILQGVAS